MRGKDHSFACTLHSLGASLSNRMVPLRRPSQVSLTVGKLLSESKPPVVDALGKLPGSNG